MSGDRSTDGGTWVQHHRRSILFLIAMLAAAGIAAALNL
ncbi:MAG: hypothetical protein JWN53_259, partial [Gemmatimonadetes bacterium]|nr:hypothetical protein [Gemmatimonadota bacterium]